MPFQDPIPTRKSNKEGIGLHSLVQAEKLLQIAFVLPSALVVGWLAGAWAATKLHQSWPTIVGIILGCISGLVYVIRLAMDAEKGIGAMASPDSKDKESNSSR